MKILFLIWISSFVLFSPNCKNEKSDKTPNTIQNQSSMTNKTYNYENRTEDLEYKIQARLEKRKSAETNAEESYISVNYTIKNHSKKNYILFNRGHSTETNPQQCLCSISKWSCGTESKSICRTDGYDLPGTRCTDSAQSDTSQSRTNYFGKNRNCFAVRMEDTVRRLL